MANAPIDSSLLDRAIVFAVKAHAGTERRGKGYPYIVHPMEAVEIVSTMTPDQELLAAAALHDTIEDTDVTYEDLEKEFGKRVADLVEAESDKFTSGVSESDSWRSRKQAAIDRLAHAPYEAKMVALGDKLSNMRAIWRDWTVKGDELWKIFHAPGGKADHEWHYRGLAASLSDLAGTFAYSEFCELIGRVFGDNAQWYATPIDLSGYKQSGEGFNAVTYDSPDGHSLVKMYDEGVPYTVPQSELDNSSKILTLGISVPRPGRLVTDGKRIGAEFERISPKKSFSRVIADDPGKLEETTVTFARMAKSLHSKHCNKHDFPSIAAVTAEEVKNANYLDEALKGRILDFIASVPEMDSCVHGDLHIGNVITNSEGCWWIDLGDFGWGNPLFDLGMFHFVTKCGEEEIIQRVFHMGKAMIDRVWEVFMKEYYGVDKKEELDEIARTLTPFAALRLIHFNSIKDVMDPGLMGFIASQFPPK